MRVEFPQGIPEGCTQWLRENVGIGNIEHGNNRTTYGRMIDDSTYAWFYKREATYTADAKLRYVPTITVKDPELAILFALKFS